MSDTTDTITRPADPDLARLDAIAKLMDNQFFIPGTNFRFGLDGIVGLIPYAGDMVGFLVSGLLFRTMMKHGAGPLLMLRMMGNMALDAVVGIVPVFGDLFDFGFKANRRNVDLLRKYYASGKPRPSAKISIFLLGVLFFILFAGMLWGIWKLGALLATWVWSHI
jgi:hypothetical protein